MNAKEKNMCYNIHMRYIGNKTKILDAIDGLLEEKGLKVQGFTFFDAFTGTASVARYFKDVYHVIANDNLYFSYVLAQAKLNCEENMFGGLGFDPFDYINGANTDGCTGFVSENFAPHLSERMYFSDENARLIDFIRQKIDEWFANGSINENEKFFLIASLLESVSKVANVAGVYGAYLKTWDPRAVKRMVFEPIDLQPYVNDLAEVYNDDVMDLISKVSGDILYLDPPYTKNQYSVQYHLLETIALYDNPVLKGKTGARDMSGLSSDFSKDGLVHVAFEKLIAEAKFKHILLSYSSDGIMSREFIESVLKRYGKKETFTLKKVSYRRYLNSKAKKNKDHCEYLFYVEKKEDPVYASPLNFIGGKHDMVGFLKENTPKDIDVYYDLFAGGFNVGINIDAKKTVYNDYNFKVKELLEYIATVDTVGFYKYIVSTMKKLNLGKENKEAYLDLRRKYNAVPMDKRDCRYLFLLIMYGFQQQIRFNNDLDYNNPVGQAGFNDKVLEKLLSFSRRAKTKNISYYSRDYADFLEEITPSDFVYVDPPYLITLGSYNDGKRGFNGWGEKEERRLLNFLTELNARGVRFMLSNVLTHKDKTNDILIRWIEENGFRVAEYDGKARGNRAEVIIVNYEA